MTLSASGSAEPLPPAWDGQTLEGTRTWETSTALGTVTLTWRVTRAPDDDHDGVPNARDRCPAAFGAQPSADGCPPGNLDSDGDAAPDATDNCVLTANPDQADGDGDGVGNVCDNCPSKANADQADRMRRDRRRVRQLPGARQRRSGRR